MYLIYVDDSGDPGLQNSRTHYFVLSALIVNEANWHSTFSQIPKLRKKIRDQYGVRLRDELKARDLIYGQGFSHRLGLSLSNRMDIYRQTLQFISTLSTIKIFSVCIRKDAITDKNLDVFTFAWKILITRVHYILTQLNQEQKNAREGNNYFR